MESNVITVTNISAFKRIAFFLCDLVINFFFCLMFTNFAVYPIARNIVNFDEIVEKTKKCENNKIKILQENKILSYKEEDKSNFNASLEYTFECYVKNFIDDSENETVIYKYFVDIKNDKSTYISLYNKINENNGYFIISDSVILKDEYKTLFSPYFDSQDTLSEVGKNKFNEFKENAFVDLYSEVIKDIKINDLKFEQLSYIAENNLSDELTTKVENLYSYSTLIGYFLISIIYFLLIPISNENRYTLSQFFLKTNRVDRDLIKPLRKRNVLIACIIQLIANMGFIVLIPSLTIGIETCFSLPYLSLLSALSVVYSIASMFFIFFNEYNRSLYDIFSNSVVIDRDDFENIEYKLGKK